MWRACRVFGERGEAERPKPLEGIRGTRKSNPQQKEEDPDEK
jgi:hypothetical protein